MKKTILSVLLSIFLVQVSYSASNNASALLNQKIQNITNNDLKEAKNQNSGITAIQVSVLLHNENAPRNFVAGRQEKNGANPATTDMMVQYGSCTKVYTSSIIIQLINEKKINLSTTLQTIFPDKFAYKKWPQQWKTVTVEQLLNMTSGITGYMIPPITKQLDQYYTLEQIVDLAAKYQNTNGCSLDFSCFKPGEQNGYSNTNYFIAGMIIEKYLKDDTNQNFNDIIQKYILTPFQKKYKSPVYYVMRYTQAMLSMMIHGYNTQQFSSFNPKLVKGQDVTTLPLYIEGPAGAFTGTTGSLVLLTRALLYDDLFKSKNTLLKTGLVLNIKTPGEFKPVSADSINTECAGKNCYGLGISMSVLKKYGQVWLYLGGTLGFQTSYFWFRKTNTIIAISYNSDGTFKPTPHDYSAIYDAILTYYKSKEPRSR